MTFRNTSIFPFNHRFHINCPLLKIGENQKIMLPRISTNRPRSNSHSYQFASLAFIGHLPLHGLLLRFAILNIVFLLLLLGNSAQAVSNTYYQSTSHNNLIGVVSTTTEKIGQLETSEIDLDRLQRTIMEGLGLARIPNASRVSRKNLV